MWWRVNKWVFLCLIVITVVTGFTRNNYQGVDDIRPELYLQPLQSEILRTDDIVFQIGDFDYILTPRYNYEISGLIVSKKDYSWFSIYKRSKALPVDLCMIWGGNLAAKVHQYKSLEFSQEVRFCSFRWSGNLVFNTSEVSNNHLLVSNDVINKEIGTLMPGDQVKIVGKLVDVMAVNRATDNSYDPAYFELRTSTIRTDTGAGACEIIYVEGIEILKKGNPISYYLFKSAIFLLGLFVVVNVARFFV